VKSSIKTGNGFPHKSCNGDRPAEFYDRARVIASSIDRWATEFRHLSGPKVLEVEEFFGEGQKGSSAMPHKRNPITNETIERLARVFAVRPFGVGKCRAVAQRTLVTQAPSELFSGLMHPARLHG